MTRRKLTWFLIPAVGLVSLAVGFGQPARPAAAPELPDARPVLPRLFSLAGTATCSARGCHGALEPRPAQAPNAPVQLNEFTKWITSHDPHARAFAVLSEKRSRDIARHLGIKDARESARCLACHTNPLAAELRGSEALQELQREERIFGVGCEACHGAADSWLAAHTTAAWQHYNAAKKQEYGMVPVHAVSALGRTCTGCHVGAPPGKAGVVRDVNHDLIAAGHPRLAFELDAFLANLPPHWNLKAKKPTATNSVRVWAVGQMTSAEAALRLLAHRARQAEKGPNKQPWPEFTEYDCFACHHDLKGTSWRQSKEHYGKRLPGSLPWGDWYFSMPLVLADQARDTKTREGIERLRLLMGRPLPDAREVVIQADALATSLASLRRQLKKQPGDAEALRARLAELAGKEPAASWDTAEQFYQAAWALKGSSGPGQFEKAFPDLTAAQAMPSGFDSPLSFQPGEFMRALAAGFKRLGP
jgi:hypothetical protein